MVFGSPFEIQPRFGPDTETYKSPSPTVPSLSILIVSSRARVTYTIYFKHRASSSSLNFYHQHVIKSNRVCVGRVGAKRDSSIYYFTPPFTQFRTTITKRFFFFYFFSTQLSTFNNSNLIKTQHRFKYSRLIFYF
jgi:hypothetical protein